LAKEGFVSTEKKFLTAAEILEADDLKVEEVDVPEWGGIVRLRPMSALEAIEYTEANKAGDKKHAAVRMAAVCVVDEDGNPAFTADQVAQLSKKSLAAFMRIQKVAMRINGLDEKETKEVKND
jgi:hypothetical protein